MMTPRGLEHPPKPTQNKGIPNDPTQNPTHALDWNTLSAEQKTAILAILNRGK